MTSHPPEPPPQWPPPPEERPVGHGQRRQPGEWRAFERPQRDQLMNGHRAADPPETSYEHEHTPDHPSLEGFRPGSYEHTPDHPSLEGFRPTGYPAPPGYPDMPDYPRDTYPPAEYPPTPDYPPMLDYPPMPDYPAAPGHPPMPGHPQVPDRPQAPDHPQAPGHQATPGHPATEYVPDGYPAANGYPRNGYPPEVYLGSRPPEGAPVTHEEYLHSGGLPARWPDALRARPAPADAAAGPAPAGMTPAGMATAGMVPAGMVPAGAVPVGAVPVGAAPVGAAPAQPAQATGAEGAQWAMLAYLTVPFFGFLVPLAVYLMSRRRSRWVRAHAAQAINVWLTGLMHCLSAAIIGLMLVLDSPPVALAVVVPLITVLWLTMLAFLVRAAAKASRGETYTFPRWLCTPIFR